MGASPPVRSLLEISRFSVEANLASTQNLLSQSVFFARNLLKSSFRRQFRPPVVKGKVFLAQSGRESKRVCALFLTEAKRQLAAIIWASLQRGPESAGSGFVDAKRTRPRPSERPWVGGGRGGP